MERIAIIDFIDGDQDSIAIRHAGPTPDAIYADIEAAFQDEGFDTITLFTRDEALRGFKDAASIDSLPTLFSLR